MIKTPEKFISILKEKIGEIDLREEMTIHKIFDNIIFFIRYYEEEGYSPEDAVFITYNEHVRTCPYYVIGDDGEYIYKWKIYKPTEQEQRALEFILENPDVVMLYECDGENTPFLRFSLNGGDEDVIMVYLEDNPSSVVDYMPPFCKSEYHLIDYKDKTFVVRIDCHA